MSVSENCDVLISAKSIEEIFYRFCCQNPEPKTELHYWNDYTLLVAVILSAQTTDLSVNKVTNILFKKMRSPQEMLRFNQEQLGALLKTIGLWREKAKNILAMSQVLVDLYDGHVPKTYEELIALPGVGRKTANVILNTLFGEPRIAVDTHIFRLSNRIGLFFSKSREGVEEGLCSRIPPIYRRHAHHWLILYGRYVCKARRPLCEKCIIADLCGYRLKTANKPYPYKIC